jgi:fructoselysine-6-P-deglycase FrlB-like protein
VLFCDEDENACHLEIYPRNNGEIYVCGCGGSDIIGEKYYDCIMSNLIVTE